MPVKPYFSEVTSELISASEKLKLGFSSHKPTIGGCREDLVARFLQKYLPKKFTVTSGLIFSANSEFSNQADVIIVDAENNAPLYPEHDKCLWPVESVYSLIEVKSSLSPRDLLDSISKCRKFKSLPRHFMSDFGIAPKIPNSLFIIWAFESPNTETVKENYLKAIAEVPRSEQPDFIICPGSYVINSGTYREIVKIGMPGSPHREMIQLQTNGCLDNAIGNNATIYELKENSLLVWLIWMISFLQGAGNRAAPLLKYLAEDENLGRLVSE